MRTLNLIGIAAFLVLLMSVPAFAQWVVDGTAICTSPGKQLGIQAASDGASGAIIVWGDLRNGQLDWDVYARRVDAAGNALWDANGVPISTTTSFGSAPVIVSNGAGGAIIAWLDRGGAPSYLTNVYAQQVDGSGSVLWAANGIPLCTFASDKGQLVITSDGAGGAILAWQDSRAGTPGIYATRVGPSGNVLWNANGVSLCMAGAVDPAIVSDGAGGAIVAWSDGDIYAGHLNASGATTWTPNGVALCTAADHQFATAITADGAGGAIVAWTDRRAGNYDIYSRRVDVSGNALWSANGVLLCAGTFADTPVIEVDGAGGAFVAWNDQRDFYCGYANHITAGGVTTWPTNGIQFAPPNGLNAPYPVLFSDGVGGVIIGWLTGDLRASRIDNSGNFLWGASGVAICSAPGIQAMPTFVASGSGAIVAWYDERFGGSPSQTRGDVFAQRVGANGQWGLPSQFVVTSPYDDYSFETLRKAIELANGTPGPQTISFNIPGSGVHTVQVAYPLPAITDELTIDGYTQPGSAPNTNPVGSPWNGQIMIDVHGGFTEDGFKFQAPGTLRGIASHSFDGRDVVVQADPVVIEGNIFGLDPTGFGGYTNRVEIWIEADHCRVGGATAASRNIISGGMARPSVGIQIEGAHYTLVYGNYVGSDLNLLNSNTGNGIGILMEAGAHANVVGFSDGTPNNPAEGNLMAYNATAIAIRGGGTIDNGVFGNVFRGNTVMGIDLDASGRTPNDVGDGDEGPNHLQNFPDVSASNGVQVTGIMHGKPNSSMILHFYRSPSFYPGDGVTYMGSQWVDTNGSGDAPFTFAPAQPMPPSYITANARDLFGSTSEMSDYVYTVNTPAGSNVPVNLVDANGVLRGTATFAQVNSEESTYIVNPYTPPVPISGFSIGNPNDPSIYFNIFTYATYTGGVDVCLSYDENNIPGPESNLVLMHYNGTMWEDVTIARDQVNNRLCGHVTTLSPFVIGAITPTDVEDPPLPTSFALHANIPNPFNPQTTIHYDIPSGGADVNISIYDVAGRLVHELVNEHRAAGTWSAQWSGEDDRGQRVASGVYFYRMRAGSFVDTKKMVLLK